MCSFLRTHRYTGWFCGSFQIQRPSDVSTSATVALDGTALHFTEGLPITRDWLDYIHTLYHHHHHEQEKEQQYITAATATANVATAHLPSPAPTLPFILSHHPTSPAKAIVVIEKEGIYHRLVEELDYFISAGLPCIFVTGKGYPDLATRGCVASMYLSRVGPPPLSHDDEERYKHGHPQHQRTPRMPVVGICDCNPYGVHVLQTYRTGGSDTALNEEERHMYSCPALDWIGLYPSAVKDLYESRELPRSVFQQMTRRDMTRLEGSMEIFEMEQQQLLVEDEDADGGEIIRGEGGEVEESGHLQELRVMQQLGYKVELEALHWLGMDYLTEWVKDLLVEYLDQWDRC